MVSEASLEAVQPPLLQRIRGSGSVGDRLRPECGGDAIIPGFCSSPQSLQPAWRMTPRDEADPYRYLASGT